MNEKQMKELKHCFGTEEFNEKKECEKCQFSRKCYDCLMDKTKEKDLNTYDNKE